jgi:hypothetical protein
MLNFHLNTEVYKPYKIILPCYLLTSLGPSHLIQKKNNLAIHITPIYILLLFCKYVIFFNSMKMVGKLPANKKNKKKLPC